MAGSDKIRRIFKHLRAFDKINLKSVLFEKMVIKMLLKLLVFFFSGNWTKTSCKGASGAEVLGFS